MGDADAVGEIRNPDRLLEDDEPAPFAIENATGRSPIVLICEHASRRIPRRLGSLGLDARDLERHIAWDIGGLGLARVLSERFDAPLLYQTWSRLVCDCNRKTTVPSFIPAASEDVRVPGNEAIDDIGRRRRIDEIYWPFHDAVRAFITGRQADGGHPVVISVHSFTPTFLGQARPWHVGVLYDAYRDLPLAVLDRLRGLDGLVIGDNQPYTMSRDTDFTIPYHAEDHDLPCLELEWRQDLVREPDGQREWGERVGGVVEAACRDLGLIG